MEWAIAAMVGLSMLAILGLLGSTAVVLTTTDIQIGGNYKANAIAFYDADAGANYAIAQMGAGIKAGTFPPPSGTPTLEDMAIGATASLAGTAFNAPSGFSFDYEPLAAPVLTKIGENRFSFATIGAGTNNSNI